MNNYNNYLKTLVLAGVPAACIVIATLYFVNNNLKSDNYNGQYFVLTGKPLAFYEDLYPVEYSDYGMQINKEKFMSAIRFLSDNKSQRAISDLLYLGQENHISFQLSTADKKIYNKFIEESVTDNIVRSENYRASLFSAYKDVVNGYGKTFSGMGVEVVLHDTRNPLKSVQAIQNPITGRRLDDPNTNFGLELIKSYSAVNKKSSSFISYKLQLSDGREIKSSTIPLFDDYLGLIGFICINIDLSVIESESKVEEFLDNFRYTFNGTKINEIIESSKMTTPTNTVSKPAFEKAHISLEKPLLIVKAKSGILACAYISEETCNKTNEACAIVSGVNTYNDMYEAKVIKISQKAEELGVRVGDKGIEALHKMNL